MAKISGREILWTVLQWHLFNKIPLTSSFFLINSSCGFKISLTMMMIIIRPAHPEGSTPCRLFISIFKRYKSCFMYATARASTSRTMNEFSSSSLGVVILSGSHRAIDLRKKPNQFWIWSVVWCASSCCCWAVFIPLWHLPRLRPLDLFLPSVFSLHSWIVTL